MSSTPSTDIGRGLVEAVRWWEDGLLGLVEQAGFPGMSRTQVLMVLEVDGVVGTSASELARRMGVTRQSIHQDVRKLTSRDLIEQVPDPSNRAAKRVVLTEAGRRMVTAADDARTQLRQALRLRLGQERADALADALAADWGEPLGPSVKEIAAAARASRAAAEEPAPAAEEPAPTPAPEAPRPAPRPVPAAAGRPVPAASPRSAPEPDPAPAADPAPEPTTEPAPEPDRAAGAEDATDDAPSKAPRPAPRPGTQGFAFPGLKVPGRPIPTRPANPPRPDGGLPA